MFLLVAKGERRPFAAISVVLWYCNRNVYLIGLTYCCPPVVVESIIYNGLSCESAAGIFSEGRFGSNKKYR